MTRLRKNQIILLLFICSILILTSFSILSYADDDDNGSGFLEDDVAKDIGYVAIGLFAVGMLNVIVLYSFKFTRKFLGDEGTSGKVKEFTKNLYMKTRKPLNWFHYLATLGATTIIILHGIRFLNEEEEMGVIGWIATGIFLFYIFTGILIKLRIKPLWKVKIVRRVLNFLHRNLIIFLGVIVLHLAHFLIAD